MLFIAYPEVYKYINIHYHYTRYTGGTAESLDSIEEVMIKAKRAWQISGGRKLRQKEQRVAIVVCKSDEIFPYKLD